MDQSGEWESSPYIAPYRVEDLWKEHLEKLTGADLSPDQVLELFELAVNTEIDRNLKADPNLLRRWQLAVQSERNTVTLP